MKISDLDKKLNQLKTEDFIWLVYIGIIFLSWYSNYLEANYFKTGMNDAKEKYRGIIILIFVILLIVYIYFLKGAYEDVKNLKPTDSEKKRTLVIMSFMGSLFITISGAIFLFLAFADDNLDVELAFN